MNCRSHFCSDLGLLTLDFGLSNATQKRFRPCDAEALPLEFDLGLIAGLRTTHDHVVIGSEKGDADQFLVISLAKRE